ncbi:MAG: DUF3644 domain-containing protein [Acidobacteriaceae bacterium]
MCIQPSRELLLKSSDIMLCAIEVYNRPTFAYRDETFCILAVNAWELLIKAKLLADNGEKLELLYVPLSKAGSGFKTSRSGPPITIELMRAITALNASSKNVPLAVEKNLDGLVQVRDNAIHLVNPRSNLGQHIYELCAACVKNFLELANRWFGMTWQDRPLYLLPLGFPQFSEIDVSLQGSPQERLDEYLRKLFESEKIDENFDVNLRVKVSFMKTASNAGPDAAVLVTNNPSATEVRLSREQRRDIYRLTHKQLCEKLREKYDGFLQNGPFNRVTKALRTDPRFAILEYLDPSNPNSSKQFFYNPNILPEIASRLKLSIKK